MKKSIKNKFSILSLSIIFSFLFTSCVTLDGFLDYTTDQGTLDVEKIASVGTALVTSVDNIASAIEGVPPEAEYAIGRSAAAAVLKSEGLYKNDFATKYVNEICSSLIINSPMPYLYKGYFVAITESDEINAISTPGGHILISKGLVECTNSEDALAAVIAHEISHIQLGHSKNAIQTERGLDVATSTLSVVLAAGGNDFTVEDVENLNNSSDSFLRQVCRDGYSQSQEYEADSNAIKLLYATGYNPFALIDMLDAINRNARHNGLGWEDTHPDPKKRIKEALNELRHGGYKICDMTSRKNRFSEFKESLK